MNTCLNATFIKPMSYVYSVQVKGNYNITQNSYHQWPFFFLPRNWVQDYCTSRIHNPKDQRVETYICFHSCVFSSQYSSVHHKHTAPTGNLWFSNHTEHRPLGSTSWCFSKVLATYNPQAESSRQSHFIWPNELEGRGGGGFYSFLSAVEFLLWVSPMQEPHNGDR